MPVSRSAATASGTRQHCDVPRITVSPARAHGYTPRVATDEVISLSLSDKDDELRTRSRGVSSSTKAAAGGSVATRKSRRRPAPLVPLQDVIEISSDDDEVDAGADNGVDQARASRPPPPPTQNAVIRELRRQIRTLQEENTKFKRDHHKVEHELLQTRGDLKAATSRILEKGKLVLDASEVDDNLNCEICTARMWSPFILPDCGHTFCQNCLQGWFSTILAHFMTVHPHYNMNSPFPPPPPIPRFDPRLPPQMLYMQLQHYQQQQQQLQQEKPEYTCPTCREPVRTRPTEEYALKSLVRTITAAAGESSPRKETAVILDRAGVKRGKAKAPPDTVRSSLWEGFFPTTRG